MRNADIFVSALTHTQYVLVSGVMIMIGTIESEGTGVGLDLCPQDDHVIGVRDLAPQNGKGLCI